VSASALSLGAWLAFAQLAAPLLLLMLVIGVAVGVLQTATQLRDAAIPFILKMAGLAALTTIAGAFMMQGVEHYATRLMGAIPRLIHG
jgi:flagellar biosynthesis protein FliQ